jgi:hypothetical protein
MCGVESEKTWFGCEEGAAATVFRWRTTLALCDWLAFLLAAHASFNCCPQVCKQANDVFAACRKTSPTSRANLSLKSGFTTLNPEATWSAHFCWYMMAAAAHASGLREGIPPRRTRVVFRSLAAVTRSGLHQGFRKRRLACRISL